MYFKLFRPTLALLTSSLCYNTQIKSHSQFITNPLLDYKNNLPKFFEIKNEHIQPAIEINLKQAENNFQKLENNLLNNKEYSYNLIIEEIEKIQTPLLFSWNIAGHLMGVKNNDELRKVYQTLQPSVVQFSQKLDQSKVLYDSLSIIKNQSNEWTSLDEAQKRIIDSSIRQMRNSGVGLSEPERSIFNQFQIEISELRTRFNNNVLDSTKEFKLTLTSPSEVEGLPTSAKALLAQQAITQGFKEATAENGPWVVTLDMPSYIACMQHLKNRNLRETIYRAYVTRASSGEKDNSIVIRDILRKRRAIAKILGFETFADLSLSKKMAPDVQTVISLLEMLREKSMPAAQAELENLKKFAKSEGFNDEIALWDVPYWSERLREKKYEFEEEQLRQYFPFEGVLTGLFSLAERLFSIHIVAADGEAEVWHKDVRFFKIYDKRTDSQEPIAAFFLDPFSRPSEKRGGAWMDKCVGKSKVYKRIPVAYLICNGSPPLDDKPSLMTFREVETLFHEFGHGLQHMLTTIEHAGATGVNNIEWDAIELPSQFMENWCYDKQTLNSFAKHYITNEPIPNELFEKVKAAKNFHSGLAMIRQLYFGILDLTLHSTYDPVSEVSPFDVQQQIAARYTVIPPLQEDRFLCSFSHIFAGGYAAGYYSYKWAEVMSADAFAAFEENDLNNEEKVRETGLKFRDTVLSYGGGKHPSEVYRLFRGKDPTPEALLRHSGLLQQQQQQQCQNDNK